MTRMKISVVIPSYNEMANLRKGTLDKVASYLARKKFEHEVIVVDDGSNDGSLEFVKGFVRENSKFKLIEKFANPWGAWDLEREVGITKLMVKLLDYFSK